MKKIILLLSTMALVLSSCVQNEIEPPINHALLMGTWEMSNVSAYGYPTKDTFIDIDRNVNIDDRDELYFFRIQFKGDFTALIWRCYAYKLDDGFKYLWGKWKDKDLNYAISGMVLRIYAKGELNENEPYKDEAFHVLKLNNETLVMQLIKSHEASFYGNKYEATYTFRRIK